MEEASALALVGLGDRGVTVKFARDPDLPPVIADRVQVQQVLLNLLRNAVEAMEASPVRELTLGTARWDSMVAVSVADTGSGIPPAIEAQLFQPFVTTKSAGMGIGLSVCRAIVEAHGGRLWVEPNPGGGSVFRFTLPVAEEATPGETRLDRPGAQSSSMPDRGGGTFVSTVGNPASNARFRGDDVEYCLNAK